MIYENYAKVSHTKIHFFNGLITGLPYTKKSVYELL